MNPNPSRNLVGDCVIRAITISTNSDWETVYMNVVLHGLKLHDMPSSNSVWMDYLKEIGYKKYIIPNTCPDCYTIKDFCKDYPYGNYLVATGSHLVCIKDKNYYDTWDSGDEIITLYFKKER